MSLLTICQNAAQYAGVNAPDTIVGNTDEDAVRLLAVAKHEVKALARRHNWTVLQREHTFSTSNGDSDYTLPSDFSRLIHNTVWNRTQTDPASGPITNQQWQEWQSGILTPVVNDNWRIFPTSGTNEFHIEPTPTATETLAFEYITNQPVESSGGTGQTDWQADSDVARLDEYLIELGVIWRALNRYGFAYIVEQAEYEAQVEMAIARDGGNRILRLGPKKMDPSLAAYTPESGYG